MRNIFTILFLFCFHISSCQKVVINGSGTNMRIDSTGAYVEINETWNPEIPLPDSVDYQIEYKAVNTKYASEIRMIPGVNTVSYKYFDYKDSLLGTGNVSTPTDDRPMSVIQGDVFDLLGLESLRTMEFFESAENTNYVAFGNLIDAGWPSFPWNGRRGTSHLVNGRICHYPYSTLTRSFGTRVVVDRVDDGTELRGGSNTRIRDSLYFFASLYHSVNNTFIALSLTKSTDLTGTSWGAEDTLLWAVGTHGGVNETWGNRFNFYGAPVNIGTKWFVPWYEHQSAVNWRVNYLYSDDNFLSWENRNIDTDQVGETSFAHLGGDTLLVLGRFDNNLPLYQNMSFNLGATWQGWQQTNLGSSTGRAMAAVLNTPEHGVVVVYGDRTTNNVMLSKNNSIADIVASPTAWVTPQIIYTTASTDLYHPLAYPDIKRVAQYRYLIIFSEHNPAGISDGQARLKIGDGRLP